MITITLNGKPRDLEGPTTLTDFLQTLGVDLEHIALARNSHVVPRDQWAQVTIEDGDVIEIVRMVGGGGTRDAAAFRLR